MTPEGMKTTKLDQILLNGNNICLVSFLLRRSFTSTSFLTQTKLVPGGEGPVANKAQQQVTA
jgi:hypothetical protein